MTSSVEPTSRRARVFVAAKVVLGLTVFWAGVILVSALQSSLLGFPDWEAALRLNIWEWGPWVVFSPLVVGVALKLPIGAGRWKIPLLVHLGCGVLVTFAIDRLTNQFAVHMLAPARAIRFLPRDGGPPPRAFPPAARVGEAAPAAAPDNAPVNPEPPTDVFIATPPPEGATVGFGPAASRGGMVRGELAAPGVFRPVGRRDLFFSEPTLFSYAWLRRARLTLPIYFLLVAAVNAWRYHHFALQRENRARRAEHQLVEAQLKALQTQLQPHFLFNSLNTISAFIHTRPEAADEMVCALSELLRSVLAMSDQQEVTLREELNLTDRYLVIHRIRFGAALRVVFDITPEANEQLVPTLLLQPLIENAVAHGLGDGAGSVAVTAHVAAGRLRLTVTDQVESTATSADATEERAADGAMPSAVAVAAPAVARARPGIGLRNTRARLETLYGASHHFSLGPVPGGMRAEIELPARRNQT